MVGVWRFRRCLNRGRSFVFLCARSHSMPHRLKSGNSRAGINRIPHPGIGGTHKKKTPRGFLWLPTRRGRYLQMSGGDSADSNAVTPSRGLVSVSDLCIVWWACHVLRSPSGGHPLVRRRGKGQHACLAQAFPASAPCVQAQPRVAP